MQCRRSRCPSGGGRRSTMMCGVSRGFGPDHGERRRSRARRAGATAHDPRTLGAEVGAEAATSTREVLRLSPRASRRPSRGPARCAGPRRTRPTLGNVGARCTPARTRRREAPGRGVRLAGAGRSCHLLHATNWDSDDLPVGRAGASSSPCVPRPTMRPSSSTRIWSASMMVDTRWATTTFTASMMTGASAARSRASVARSSAENESSKR